MPVPARTPDRRARLEPLTGGDVVVATLDGARSFVIGSDAGADLRLAPRARDVPLRCRLSLQREGWVLVAEEDRAAVSVNGRPVTGPTLLCDGDTVRFFTARLRFRDDAALDATLGRQWPVGAWRLVAPTLWQRSARWRAAHTERRGLLADAWVLRDASRRREHDAVVGAQRALARVSHRAVPRVLDAQLSDDGAVVVFEDAAGASLGEVMAQTRIEASMALSIIAEVAAALSAAPDVPAVIDGQEIVLDWGGAVRFTGYACAAWAPDAAHVGARASLRRSAALGVLLWESLQGAPMPESTCPALATGSPHDAACTAIARAALSGCGTEELAARAGALVAGLGGADRSALAMWVRAACSDGWRQEQALRRALSAR